MVGVISLVENGHEGMANSFLVLVLHKTLHGTISILLERPKLAANVGNMGPVKNKVPSITQRPGPAQSAAAEMPWHDRFRNAAGFARLPAWLYTWTCGLLNILLLVLS